jgi:hypothetical protein
MGFTSSLSHAGTALQGPQFTGANLYIHRELGVGRQAGDITEIKVFSKIVEYARQLMAFNERAG